MAITRLLPDGYGGKRVSSFAGKEASSGDGPHTPSILTQLQLGGWGGKRFGTFAGKETSGGGGGTHTPGILTQLQLGGWGGMRFGSFAGKSPSSGGTSDSNITIDDQWDGITNDESLRFSGITGMYNG